MKNKIRVDWSDGGTDEVFVVVRIYWFCLSRFVHYGSENKTGIAANSKAIGQISNEIAAVLMCADINHERAKMPLRNL